MTTADQPPAVVVLEVEHPITAEVERQVLVTVQAPQVQVINVGGQGPPGPPGPAGTGGAQWGTSKW
ncbi:hypothetical protein [Pseudomonas sp. RIT-PI-AD]|uniref:hypothetical protein n=1 Tax=Pseudomonas sp. RIT-PI-AD TaxID=3035294 RepID=UPI0021DB7603|nr:hypothetical protein [Pseudomonas sp. RIT-PI-AD]